MYANVFIIYELSSAWQLPDVWKQVVLLPCRTAKRAVLDGRGTNWFQTSCNRGAKLEFNSINWVRHDSSTRLKQAKALIL